MLLCRVREERLIVFKKKVVKSLMSALYRYWGPLMNKEELGFYERVIREGRGAALEVACGSGRLYLPLLKKGLDIEGIEESREMLDLLRYKARQFKLTPKVELFEVEKLKSKRKYTTIFIAMGSFQMISSKKRARVLLEDLYHSLEEGGKLYISLFCPEVTGLLASHDWAIVNDYNYAQEKKRFVRREKVDVDLVEQHLKCIVRYETWMGKDLESMVEKKIHLNWYSKNEFIGLLKDIGYAERELHRNYIKGKNAQEGFMLFSATRRVIEDSLHS